MPSSCHQYHLISSVWSISVSTMHASTMAAIKALLSTRLNIGSSQFLCLSPTPLIPWFCSTIRCDCPAAFYLLMKDSVLTVKKFKMVHNHPPEPFVVKRKRLVKRSQVVEAQSPGRSYKSTSPHLLTCPPDLLKELAPCPPSVNMISVRKKTSETSSWSVRVPPPGEVDPWFKTTHGAFVFSSTRTYRDALQRLHELVDYIQASGSS